MKSQKFKSPENHQLDSEKLNQLRISFPKVHLYEKPFIGTEEIRQFSYCKRKLYFRHVLNAPMKQTYKMKYGTEQHEEFIKQVSKSTDSIQKYNNIYLTDARLGLVGFLDYFEYDGVEAYPVEIKTGNIPSGRLENPDKMQATAQAILIEANFDFLVKKVRVYYAKYQEIVDYSIGVDDKMKVFKTLKEIQEMIEKETIPKPTPNRNRCRDCECKKYCLRSDLK